MLPGVSGSMPRYLKMLHVSYSPCSIGLAIYLMRSKAEYSPQCWLEYSKIVPAASLLSLVKCGEQDITERFF